MLEHWLKHGEQLTTIVPKCLAMGLPIPEPFKDPPELLEHAHFYYNAFTDLHTCRSDGVIPWTTCMQYAERLGLDDEQAEELWEYIRALDVAWNEHQKTKGPKGE